VTESLRFDTYYRYDELTELLRGLEAAYPDLLTISSIGTSYEGRDIWCATMTARATGPAEHKPAVYVDGNIHATEVSASSACLYFLWQTLQGYGTDPEVRRCLDTRAFYVIPRLNPDGPELYLRDNPRSVRSSVRPYPYDEEPIGGLKVEDIDGDGRVLTMRVPDSHGAWKISDRDPRLMVRRDPTEVGGTYYRLLPEGRVDDYDGIILNIQRTPEGLDLNRNYPAHWRTEQEQHGAGPFPTSEPEVRAAVAFITSHPNIIAGVAFHTYSGVLLRPYGTQSDESMPAEDLWAYQSIGDKGLELTGYPAISVYHDFRYHPKEVITGVFDDWLYDHLGAFGWTVEIWCPQREAGIPAFGPGKPEGGYRFIDWYRDHPADDDLKLLHWNDTALDGKGFVPWTPFEHPDLGAVEIGGWDTAYCWRNPPPELLEKEIARFPEWLRWQALISPRLTLDRFTCEPLGDGTYKLTLVVDNEGWLPTYGTKKALERGSARPVIAEITLPEGASLEIGQLRTELGHLEGRNGKSAASIGWMADPTDERARVEYVIRAQAGDVVKAVVRAERAGRIETEVALR